jgi:hypothetical protein
MLEVWGLGFRNFVLEMVRMKMGDGAKLLLMYCTCTCICWRSEVHVAPHFQTCFLLVAVCVTCHLVTRLWLMVGYGMGLTTYTTVLWCWPVCRIGYVDVDLERVVGIGLWMESLWRLLLLLDAINRLEIYVVGGIIDLLELLWGILVCMTRG